MNSDGEEQDQRRKLLAHRMLPGALRSMGDAIQEQAQDLVSAAVKREYVDGVADLATALPLAVVPEMQRVSRIELAGEPIWTLNNNIIRCYERLPLRLIAE